MSQRKDDRDRIMGHGAENDGIEEYDNPLPDWWVGLFLLCIVWAFAYAVEYHWVSARSQAKTYDAEVAVATARWPVQAASLAIDLSPAALDRGRTIFAQNCAACHGKELQGGIGPNLTDTTWIHGGSYAEIQATITNGVPAKGMLTWGPILGPAKIAEVAAFVYASSPREGLETKQGG